LSNNKKTYYLIRYPAIKVLIPLIAGIYVSKYLDLPLFTALVISSISFLGLLILERKWVSKIEAVSIPVLFIFVTSVSFLRTELEEKTKLATFHSFEKTVQFADSVQLFGEINEVKETNRAITYTLKLDSLQADYYSDSLHQFKYKPESSAQIQLIQYIDDFNSDEKNHLLSGQKISANAKYRSIKEKRNPNQFDYSSYLYSKGILGQFVVQDIMVTNPPNWLSDLKNKFQIAVESIFSKEHIGVAKALILGDKSDIDPDTRLAFNRSGLAHLMAVSGLHVGFLIAPFWFIIPFFWTRQIARHISIVFLGFTLLGYCWLTGFSPSVVRASLMVFIFSYAKLYEQIRSPMNIVGFAAICLLVYKPNYIFDIGFQLSFGAVSLIITVFPFFQRLIGKQSFWKKILSSILLGIVVQLGLAPLLISYFGELSLISPLTNLIAMIPASIMVLAGLLGTISVVFFPSLAPILSYPLNFIAWSLEWLAKYFSTTEFSYAVFSAPSPFVLITWVFFLGTLAIWQNREFRWKWVALTLGAFALFSLDNLFDLIQEKPFKVIVFDIGQGDANFIETPDGKTMLIDTGVWSPNYNSGTRTIVPELNAMGVQHINAIVLTHPHADHIGGTIPILEKLKVDTLFTDSASVLHKSKIYEAILDLAKEKHIPIKPLFSGDKIDLGKTVNVRVVWPLRSYALSNLNEMSTVIRMDYKKTSFLFTGDTEDAGEEWMSEHLDEVIDTDFLKVGHHGSKSSSHKPFLEYNTPLFASVSLAEVNKYKHPHAESMKRLQEFTNAIHFTSLSGAAIYESNGNEIRKIDWREKGNLTTRDD